MKQTEQQLYDALFDAAVADREKIRAAVLDRAHWEFSSAQTEAAASPVCAPAPAPDAVPLSGKVRFRGPGAEGSSCRKSGWRRFVLLPLAACLTFFVLVNVSAPFASAVERVPVLSSVARVITFRSWASEDEASSIQAQQPAIEGSGNPAFEETVNARIEEKLTALNEAARSDAAEYRENWIAMGNDAAQFVPIGYTFDYETYYSAPECLSFLIRQRETLTTDTENTYTTLYYYNLNPTTGAELTLRDLLGPDWKTLAAETVDAQIRAGGDARQIAYYQEFWVDKNVPLDESQKFYVNSGGRVVLVFDEGWIAPFEDGPQFFEVPEQTPTA